MLILFQYQQTTPIRISDLQYLRKLAFIDGIFKLTQFSTTYSQVVNIVGISNNKKIHVASIFAKSKREETYSMIFVILKKIHQVICQYVSKIF